MFSECYTNVEHTRRTTRLIQYIGGAQTKQYMSSLLHKAMPVVIYEAKTSRPESELPLARIDVK